MIWQIITIIFVIIIIPIAIFITIRLRRDIQKIDVTANMPFVENDYRKEFTEGYTLGILKAQIPCKNGCERIEFFPIDVEQGEGIAKPIHQAVIVRNDFIKRFARGKLSSRRERIKLITRNPSLIPSELKDETEGKWVSKEGQKAWLTSTFGQMISSGDEAVAEAMKDYARGNLPKVTLSQLKDIVDQFKKIKIEQPEESKSKNI